MEYPQLNTFRAYMATERGLAPATLEAYLRDLTGFANILRRRGGSLETFTADDIRQYVQGQSLLGMTPATITRRLMSLRAFITFQSRKDGETLLASIELPKKERHLPNIVNEQQVTDLLAVAKTPRNLAIIEMFYATGMRVSELCGLKLKDLNLEQGWVRVFGKGSKERMVPMNEAAITAVRAYLAQGRPAGEEHVFLSMTGQPMGRGDVGVIIRKAGRAAGLLKNVSPHTLRHCFASHLLSGGANLRLVQELLGHESIETTQVYTHVDLKHLKKMHALHPRG
jgi:integrase/recombinase XerD